MNQIKEAITELETAETCCLCTDDRLKPIRHIQTALALLKEQPPASDFMKEIESTGLMEYESDKHSIIKLKEACGIIDRQNERIFELVDAIQKAIPLIHHDNGFVGKSEIQAIKILEKPIIDQQKANLTIDKKQQIPNPPRVAESL